MDREEVARNQRARLYGAMIEAVSQRGYHASTVAHVIGLAGVSRRAFYEQFANKEQCFLAVLDEFVQEALESVKPSMESAGSWPEAVYAAMAAFVDYLVAHQALLRIAFINLFEVGPGMIGRMTRSVEGFTKLLTETGPEPQRGPAVALEAVTGAVWGIIGTYVANDRLSRLPSLVDQLAFTVLAPYVGAKTAIETIAAARKPLRAV
jgi:AcrR family transcriptional regulator